FCFVGSLFSKGNGRIYTVILGFIIGLYLSKKVVKLVRKKTKNKIRVYWRQSFDRSFRCFEGII
ncbi:MAG: hypothetical protein QGI89_03500, partial [Candidatus Woesearchaeota archaeon]|nr:hypothetical protein [Candidatus Woesearchaeota archaeon]